MELYAGTSGYSYKEWKGPFYPKALPDQQMLHFYGEHFRAVEINNTFYRMPKASVLEHWAQEVPTDFKFVLKAPRRITHQQFLQDVDDPMAYLLGVTRALKEHLGPLLIQLPPRFKKNVPRLREFLTLLDSRCRAAFEFRHPSWFDDEVFDVLRDSGAALCIADAEDKLQVPFATTADWGYLRLRRPDYGDSDLRHWANAIATSSWTEAFVFFKHEEAGKGPKLTERFLELAAPATGLPS